MTVHATAVATLWEDLLQRSALTAGRRRHQRGVRGRAARPGRADRIVEAPASETWIWSDLHLRDRGVIEARPPVPERARDGGADARGLDEQRSRRRHPHLPGRRRPPERVRGRAPRRSGPGLPWAPAARPRESRRRPPRLAREAGFRRPGCGRDHRHGPADRVASLRNRCREPPGDLPEAVANDVRLASTRADRRSCSRRSPRAVAPPSRRGYGRRAMISRRRRAKAVKPATVSARATVTIRRRIRMSSVTVMFPGIGARIRPLAPRRMRAAAAPGSRGDAGENGPAAGRTRSTCDGLACSRAQRFPSRGGRERPDRGSDPGQRRHQADPADGVDASSTR